VSRLATPIRPLPDRPGPARIVHLQRKPFTDQFSIEQLFDSLRQEMKSIAPDLEVSAATAPFPSKGFWYRLRNTVWAARNQGDVNHITGDVHFLGIGTSADRTILTIHDCFNLERLSGLKRWIMRLFWFDLPVRRATFVTVISEETRRELLRFVRMPVEKIIVIPDAVSSIYRPCPKTFDASCPRVLHIGTKPNKNLPRLIEAVRGLNCHLSIVGVLESAHRRQAEQSGIRYDARENLTEPEMYEAYCDADIVSFASTYEGFGMPIIESQWVERPVVTSNRSSMPEVAGDGACLVNPFDVKSIRCGLRRVMEDASYRETLIERGRKNRERFSLNTVAMQYVSLYERLLGSSFGNSC
jgi:glycosyltransferase involved in cell wall biosynthesis